MDEEEGKGPVGAGEPIVEAGKDLSKPEELLVEAENIRMKALKISEFFLEYGEVIQKLPEFLERYSKEFAGLVKVRGNLQNMLQREQERTGDLERKLEESSSEIKEIRSELTLSDEKIREYLNVMRVYDTLLRSARRDLDAVTSLTEKFAGMDKRWIEITEKVGSLSERNEGLGQTNADLMEVVRQLREENERLGKELSDYKKMPTVEIVEPIPEPDGKTFLPYKGPPAIMQAVAKDSTSMAHGRPAAGLVVGMEGFLDIPEKTEKSAEDEEETPKYDASRTTKAPNFSTTDAFHYVVMEIYNGLDKEKKEKDIVATAGYIEEVLVTSLKKNELDERITEFIPSDGFAIMKKYFAEIAEYTSKTGEAPSDKLKDVVLSCCATVFEMKKDGNLERNMGNPDNPDKTGGLGVRYDRYKKTHIRDLPM